jgi:hypothetical protein
MWKKYFGKVILVVIVTPAIYLYSWPVLFAYGSFYDAAGIWQQTAEFKEEFKECQRQVKGVGHLQYISCFIRDTYKIVFYFHKRYRGASVV